MFENLRAAFREAIGNFKEELGRDEVPEAVDRLLHGMRQEATEAKTRLHDLDQAIRRALAEAEREKRELDTCERRERMARQIGDEDTAKVAAEFGRKHLERKEVLEQKAVALEKELALRKREIEEMLNQIREAQKRRDALAAEVGRSSARESIRGSRDLFDEMEKMGDEGRRGDAAEELYQDTGGDDWDADLGLGSSPPPRPEVDMDARLAELKKRMGKE
jgi:phage shock protein A